MTSGTDALIDLALQEDIGHQDITTNALFDEHAGATARIVAKEAFLLAGMEVFFRVFHRICPDIKPVSALADGTAVDSGTIVARLSGPVRALLTGERTALNFLQRLSGVATYTKRVTDRVKNYPVRIVDTRKTTPGWRYLEKQAVRVGGGCNHRFGLYDSVLIKDNHIEAAGGIAEAVARARAQVPFTAKVEVEVETMAQVDEALAAKADIVMLDNMSVEKLRAAVQKIDGAALVEASGGITPDTVVSIAQTGVDVISMGMLTTAATAVDIGMDLEQGWGDASGD
jgi:nicotinate-nucleotide pyrophosphorylase (carboxylating)